MMYVIQILVDSVEFSITSRTISSILSLCSDFNRVQYQKTLKTFDPRKLVMKLNLACYFQQNM